MKQVTEQTTCRMCQGKDLKPVFSLGSTPLANNFLSKKEFVLSGERLFNSVNPKRVLKMGYSIARNKKGQILRQANQVDVGDKIVVELKEGKIVAEVKKV